MPTPNPSLEGICFASASGRCSWEGRGWVFSEIIPGNRSNGAVAAFLAVKKLGGWCEPAPQKPNPVEKSIKLSLDTKCGYQVGFCPRSDTCPGSNALPPPLQLSNAFSCRTKSRPYTMGQGTGILGKWRFRLSCSQTKHVPAVLSAEIFCPEIPRSVPGEFFQFRRFTHAGVDFEHHAFSLHGDLSFSGERGCLQSFPWRQIPSGESMSIKVP